MVTAMLISSDRRQRDDNDLQDERQDQPEEEVEPRRSKRARKREIDMGLADVILVLKIYEHRMDFVKVKHIYMDKILNTHNAGDSGQARTPIDTSTRPDLAYAVSRLSGYASNQGYDDEIGYIDIKDSRSTSGYVFTLGGAAISWKSLQANCYMLSTRWIRLSS
ncbi:hypothetical protein Tco_0970900 [Tanacetum coccineum]